MAIKGSTELLELLNAGVARELQVAVQYIYQHMKMEGILRKVKAENILLAKTTYDAVGAFLKEMAIEEMKHAGALMERIYVLGGQATTKSDPPKIGKTLKDFVEFGFKEEKVALELYDKIVKQAMKDRDVTTAQMLRQIYKDEEKHLRKFEEYLNIDLSEPNGPDDVETEHVKVYTNDYFQLLGKAAAAEVSAIVQYTNQHEKAEKIALRSKSSSLEVITENNKAKVVSGLLKGFFMQEMDHLEKICERIYKLGGEPPYNPDPLPQIGETVDDFLRLGKQGEDYAIVLYRKIVNKAAELGDIVTKRIFESIIEDEDTHYWELDDYF